jgi:hypothetical protein
MLNTKTHPKPSDFFGVLRVVVVVIIIVVILALYLDLRFERGRPWLRIRLVDNRQGQRCDALSLKKIYRREGKQNG